MKYQSMLYEALALVSLLKSQQGETDSCVMKRIDQVSDELESLKLEKLSEPELAASILVQFGLLFAEFPEIAEYTDSLANSDVS